MIERQLGIRFRGRDLALLLLSILLQLGLGVAFGHLYDQRIFMASGYLAATGQNPYLARDLSAVFHNPTFENITSVGYPPPWPLLLGLIYRASYAWFPSLLAYNLAIKLPILFANLALAFLTAAAVARLGGAAAWARKAWIFMLFNPFVLIASSAWGQFDSLVVLLALSSLLFLDTGRIKTSALVLALAVAFKPTALPLLLIPFFYLKSKSLGQAGIYYGVALIGAIVFCVLPFPLLGWDAGVILKHWNAHFVVGGGLSFITFLEPMLKQYQLPEGWWWLGWLWAPALALTAMRLWRGIFGLKDLLMKSAAAIMVFFLTRAWLSEPNVLLLLPFIIILTSIDELDRRGLALMWCLPMLFSVFNTAVFQLLFPSLPELMDKGLAFAGEHATLRLAAEMLIVAAWQITGWFIVARCLRGSTLAAPVGAFEDNPGKA